MDKNKRVAIVGTNGIPAKYGGFETLAENLTFHLYSKYQITVYCSKKQKTGLKTYNNCKLITLPLNANGWQSIIYDFISLLHAWCKSDIILVLGPASGFALPLNVLFRKKIIVNHGGLNEWERKKYSTIQSKISYINHSTAAKFATHRIADNSLLADSIQSNFGEKAEVIRYGGDHANRVPITEAYLKKYPFLSNKYVVSVSRAQIDNNIHLVLEAFEQINSIKLVLVSNWQISKYGIDLKEKYKNHENMILLDAIYNQDELNLIRSNATIYIHSHSQCGTAPSLVEAMCLGLPIVSFDVPTNRETTQDKAIYFSDSTELKEAMNSLTEKDINNLKTQMYEIANSNYSWQKITEQYELLFEKE